MGEGEEVVGRRKGRRVMKERLRRSEGEWAKEG